MLLSTSIWFFMVYFKSPAKRFIDDIFEIYSISAYIEAIIAQCAWTGRAWGLEWLFQDQRWFKYVLNFDSWTWIFSGLGTPCIHILLCLHNSTYHIIFKDDICTEPKKEHDSNTFGWNFIIRFFFEKKLYFVSILDKEMPLVHSYVNIYVYLHKISFI